MTSRRENGAGVVKALLEKRRVTGRSHRGAVFGDGSVSL